MLPSLTMPSRRSMTAPGSTCITVGAISIGTLSQRLLAPAVVMKLEASALSVPPRIRTFLKFICELLTASKRLPLLAISKSSTSITLPPAARTVALLSKSSPSRDMLDAEFASIRPPFVRFSAVTDILDRVVATSRSWLLRMPATT